MSGHQSTVASLLTHAADPQVISGSHDKQIRLWDIRTGNTLHTLTYHKKSVRALAMSDQTVLPLCPARLSWHYPGFCKLCPPTQVQYPAGWTHDQSVLDVGSG